MTEALALYREIGDERGVANVLWGIGNSATSARPTTMARPSSTEALEIFRRVGDRTMEAWSLHMLGTALLRLGRWRRGRAVHLRDALRLFHGVGDVAGITLALDDLAAESVALGDLPRAARL